MMLVGINRIRYLSWFRLFEVSSHYLVWSSAILLAGVVGTNAWKAYRAYQASGAVRCDEPVFDFGTASSGDVIHHSFRVVNIGRYPLKICNILTDCGCTTITDSLKGKSIAPQEALYVPVTLSLTGSEEGEVQKKVLIQMVGVSSLQLMLRLNGRVEHR